jgi:hypothetical protein
MMNWKECERKSYWHLFGYTKENNEKVGIVGIPPRFKPDTPRIKIQKFYFATKFSRTRKVTLKMFQNATVRFQ